MPKVLVAAKAKSERAHPDSVQAKLRRQALDDALHEHELRPADLARMAGLPNANLIYNILRGRTASLNTITWERLLPHLPRSNIGLLLGTFKDLVNQRPLQRMNGVSRRRCVAELQTRSLVILVK